MKVSDDKYYDYLVSEYNKPFVGWNFAYIDNRMTTEPLEWDYLDRITIEIKKSNSLLDMDTGGGEFLYSLRPLPINTYATEAYKPNVAVAKERLEPIGVKVVEVTEHKNLDLPSNYFDLIINRHGTYSLKEINRILKNGSKIITQQVGVQIT